MPSIFVVWDTKKRTIHVHLQDLMERGAGGYDITAKGIDREGGRIIDNVIDGIQTADRVLVLTDSPNANVGFEAGFAVGLGKPLLFAFHGRKLPDWTKTPPLKNYILAKWYQPSELEDLIASEKAWFTPPATKGLPPTGDCLDLCPSEGIGEVYRRRRDEMDLSGWLRLDDLPRPSLSNLNDLLGHTARLVWTITEPKPNDGDWDVRDGTVNAANGIIAGWFYSRCLRNREGELPFWVLRYEDARPVVDVETYEETVRYAREYVQQIKKIETVWESLRPEERSAVSPETAAEASSIRIAVIPFKDLSSHESGESFAMGLTDDLRATIKKFELVETVPRNSAMRVKRKKMTNEEAIHFLGAHYIVRGSLAQQGDRCLLEVSVFRKGASNPLRSYRREERWDEVLRSEVPQRIAKEIASLINLKVPADLSLPIYNARAKELFWRASQAIDEYNNSREPATAEKARRLLHKTNVLEPLYEEAFVQTGFLDVIRWETVGARRLLEDGLDIWEGILTRRPADPIALSERAYTRFVLGEDRASTLRSAQAAAEQNPDHPISVNVLAVLYLFMGFYESNIVIEEKVMKIDPAYVYPITNAALAYQLMGQYAEACSLAEQAADIDPEAFIAKLRKGTQLFHLGELRQAQEVWEEGREAASEEVQPVFETVLSWLMSAHGHPERGVVTIAEYRDEEWVDGWYGPYFVSLCALCGKSDEAIDLLEKQTTFASSYRYLIADPTLRPLRAQPRFKRLLERRYAEWEESLRSLVDSVPERPATLSDPNTFLRGE